MASSDDSFDRCFRDHVREVDGINVEDAFPPPEQVMDFRTGRGYAAAGSRMVTPAALAGSGTG
jgi:hypothetical protein